MPADFHRPGPESIPPGTAPGGVVVHVYTLDDVLVLTSYLAPSADVMDVARRDRDKVDLLTGAGVPVVLVAYDGDSGTRYTAEQWTADQWTAE